MLSAIVVASVGAACGDDGEGDAGAGGSGGAGGGGGSGGTPVLITVKGAAFSFSDGEPLADVRVCVRGHDEVACTTSDAAGAYTLTGVPGDSDLALDLTRADFFPYLRHIRTGEAELDIGVLDHVTVDEANAIVALGGEEVDATKGHVIFRAGHVPEDGSFTGTAGVSFTLAPPSGHLFYIGESGFPEAELTETSSAGLGGFVNAAAGAYVVSFADGGAGCTLDPVNNWTGDAPTAARLEVAAGYVSFGPFVACPP